jgi:hypothetical protein
METPETPPIDKKSRIPLIIAGALIVSILSLSSPWLFEYLRIYPHKSNEEKILQNIHDLEFRVSRLEQQPKKTNELLEKDPSVSPVISINLTFDKNTAFDIMNTVARLKTLGRTSSPFKKELDELNQKSQKGPQDLKDLVTQFTNALNEMAPLGVPTREQLLYEFPKVAKDLVSTPEDPENITENVIQKLKSYYWIRPMNGSTNSSEDILSRTEILLRQGNLVHALESLNHLTPLQKKHPSLQKWIAHGQARLTLEESLNILDLLPLTLLIQGGQK